MTIENNKKILPICELYTCIQGEGSLSGIPHILIRMTGCPLRCQFGNSFCDTPYASWKPEKGKYKWDDIVKIYDQNPQIQYTMITGGSPTMHKNVLRELTNFISDMYGHIITIETEGSKYVSDLSNRCFMILSPKLESSIPKVGTINPFTGKKVTEHDKIRHEKNRTNYDEMKKLLDDYGGHLKPVINYDTFEQDVAEVKKIQKILEVENYNVYLMPAGVNNEELMKNRKKLVEYCVKFGYNYTDRLHIIIYGNQRGV